MNHHTYTLYFLVDRTVVTNCKHNTFNMVVMLVFGSSDKKLHISKAPIIPAIFRTPYWTMPVLPHHQSMELRPNSNHLFSSFGPISSHWIHSILMLRNQYTAFQFSWCIMCVKNYLHDYRNWEMRCYNFIWILGVQKESLYNSDEYLRMPWKYASYEYIFTDMPISSLKFSYIF
jgi:hypothetical protein